MFRKFLCYTWIHLKAALSYFYNRKDQGLLWISYSHSSRGNLSSSKVCQWTRLTIHSRQIALSRCQRTEFVGLWKSSKVSSWRKVWNIGSNSVFNFEGLLSPSALISMDAHSAVSHRVEILADSIPIPRDEKDSLHWELSNLLLVSHYEGYQNLDTKSDLGDLTA